MIIVVFEVIGIWTCALVLAQSEISTVPCYKSTRSIMINTARRNIDLISFEKKQGKCFVYDPGEYIQLQYYHYNFYYYFLMNFCTTNSYKVGLQWDIGF